MGRKKANEATICWGTKTKPNLLHPKERKEKEKETKKNKMFFFPAGLTDPLLIFLVNIIS